MPNRVDNGPNKRCQVTRALGLCWALAGCMSASAHPLTYVPSSPNQSEALAVKIVIVAMFERGEDRGDIPGELQLWVDNGDFDERVDNPAGHHPIWVRNDGLIATVVGVGHAKAAASVTALALDPRFNFDQAYWIVAGIAGVDPEDASLASVAIARYVVNGSLAHELDARDVPDDWSVGILPLGSSAPFEVPPRDRKSDLTMVYSLNASFAQWAYELTRDIELPDSEAMADRREDYREARARTPPIVLLGDVLSSGRFWHGRRMNDFANEWVRFWTRECKPTGNFVMSSMEDAGSLQALEHASSAGRVDFSRILVLRSASNYTTESANMTAVESMRRERGASFSAYLESLQAVHRVGSRVADELMDNWEKYEHRVPE